MAPFCFPAEVVTLFILRLHFIDSMIVELQAREREGARRREVGRRQTDRQRRMLRNVMERFSADNAKYKTSVDTLAMRCPLDWPLYDI